MPVATPPKDDAFITGIRHRLTQPFPRWRGAHRLKLTLNYITDPRNGRKTSAVAWVIVAIPGRDGVRHISGALSADALSGSIDDKMSRIAEAIETDTDHLARQL